MFKKFFGKKKVEDVVQNIEFRKVVATNSGMHCFWEIPEFAGITDYDSWEKELLVNEDIEHHIDKGAFVPINIQSDGVFDIMELLIYLQEAMRLQCI